MCREIPAEHYVHQKYTLIKIIASFTYYITIYNNT